MTASIATREHTANRTQGGRNPRPATAAILVKSVQTEDGKKNQVNRKHIL